MLRQADRLPLKHPNRMALFSRISGTGSALPERRLTNSDLVNLLAERGLETSDEWIVERTGIRARHFADAGTTASDLAFKACEAALQAADCAISDIDLIVVGTSTPDMVFPSTATILQHKLTQAALARGEAGGAGGAAAGRTTRRRGGRAGSVTRPRRRHTRATRRNS